MAKDRNQIGAIILGTPGLGANYLRCDGADYLRTDYPILSPYEPDAYSVTQFFPSGAFSTGNTWGAVGTDGTNVVAFTTLGLVAKSTDSGATWTSLGNQLAGGPNIKAVAWNSTVFCAVGTDGSGSGPACYTSTDGVTWTFRETGATNALTDIAWNGTVFCALETASARSWTSSDGITWAQRTMPSSTNWNGIAWSSGLTLFVAVSLTSGTAAASSPDGTTWTARTIISGAYAKVAWNGTNFAAVQTSGTTAAYSANGTSWTTTTQISGTWIGITWNSSTSKFIAVQNTSSTTAMTSPDGVTWTTRTLVNALNSKAITTISGTTIAVGVAAIVANVLTTTDGVTWVASYTGNPPPWATSINSSFAVLYANGNWFGFINGLTTYFISSDNGATWAAHTFPIAVSITEQTTTALAYSSSLGLYVLAACSSQADVYSSPDGTTWTGRAMPSTSSWASVIWNGSTFVCVSNTAASTKAAYSTNGTSWSASTLPSSQTWGTLASDGTNFVVFPQNASVSEHTCARSTDGGHTWSAINSAVPSVGTLVYTLWNGTVFLSISNSSAALCQTSPDGSTWTATFLPGDISSYTLNVAIVNNGVFYLLIGAGSINYILSSVDGRTWHVLNLPSQQVFNLVGNGSTTLLALTQAFELNQCGNFWLRLAQSTTRFRVPPVGPPQTNPNTRDSLLNFYYVRAK